MSMKKPLWFLATLRSSREKTRFNRKSLAKVAKPPRGVAQGEHGTSNTAFPYLHSRGSENWGTLVLHAKA